MIYAPVLDKGFIELLSYTGSDRTIAEAARTSSGKSSENIEPLIRYLMKHSHTSPFEMGEFTFRIKAPIFIARQWLRHRTASINEESGRYKELKCEFYTPNVFYTQSNTNKQMSDMDDPLPDEQASELNALIQRHLKNTMTLYKHLLVSGVSREDARIILPLNLYTTWIWKIDLHNLFHFIKLRLDPKAAQHQMVAYARCLLYFPRHYFPISTQAFEDYKLNAITLSALEVKTLRSLIQDIELDEEGTLSKSELLQLKRTFFQ